MHYEYYTVSTAAPYRKTTVYPGIAIPDYPTYAGSVYFTRRDEYWDGSGWNSSKSLWYMRQRDTSIIEEIVDEGLACPEWGAWGPLYHNFNNITHAYGTSGVAFESIPICTQTRTGPGTFATVCQHRWYSVCRYVQYYSSWGGYNDVVKMTFQHGNVDRTVLPSVCSSPHVNPPGCTHKPPYSNSYWEEKWFAKGVGKIYNKIIFYESPHCDGSYYSGTVWEQYLHTYYG